MDRRVDPAYRTLNFSLSLAPRTLPLLQALGREGYRRAPLPRGVEAQRYRVGDRQAGFDVEVLGPQGAGGPLPGLVYFHGGAFALEAAPHHRWLAAAYALGAGCRVVVVHYRLAPQHPFPQGLDDAWEALVWTRDRAVDLGIDPEGLAVGGDSAGAALAAGVTHRARDRGGPRLKFQMLVYPVTDARQTSPSMAEFTTSPLWNARLNHRMWRLYLGPHPNEDQIRAASPLLVDDLGGLPPAYVEVAEVDCLRDEGLAYAEGLRAAGVEVTLARPAGTLHGFELAWKARRTQAIVADRIGALRRGLGLQV